MLVEDAAPPGPLLDAAAPLPLVPPLLLVADPPVPALELDDLLGAGTTTVSLVVVEDDLLAPPPLGTTIVSFFSSHAAAAKAPTSNSTKTRIFMGFLR